MIEKINSPTDLRGLSADEVGVLTDEIRKTIINTVSTNGGHLASNLGMVEAAVALHRTFDSPADKIIFDVGHQCYAHKLLTGRYGEFSTLRRLGGLSGFTNPLESEHDIMFEGHSGTSVSAALGIAEANKLYKNGNYAIAVVGDGSLTNGMIYEALNNCADKELDLIILINDNEMSISSNVGGLHNYLARIRTSKGYFSFKRSFEHFLSAIPGIGVGLAKMLKLIKDGIKRLFIKDTVFEDLGLIYLGPVDGHDIKRLCRVLEEAKQKHRCCVVHMLTKKGRGYAPAEEKPDRYHAVGCFDAKIGITDEKADDSFSSSVGNILCDIAKEDRRICAITAAMRDGTGLSRFAEEFPERFFDVGIAEEHAVTFAGGLSAAGMIPVVALYSTFAQRVYDQLLHDIATQRLPMVLLLDRCGIVPGDGITHQGIFDYPLFSSVPGITIYAPINYTELEADIKSAVSDGGLTVVRYPKGSELSSDADEPVFVDTADNSLCYTEDIKDAGIVLVTYGRCVKAVLDAARILSEKHKVGIIRLKRIFPIDTGEIDRLTAYSKLVVSVEEGIQSGGVGEKIASALSRAGASRDVAIKAATGFIMHGTVDELTEIAGLDGKSIAEFAKALIHRS